MSTSEVVSARTARRLLLHLQGLSADPGRRATPAAVYDQIERMGFVQIDKINVVERAHHHILQTRFDAYRPRMLAKLLERDRKLFEHWTHDAAALPTCWLAHWQHRFEAWRQRMDPTKSRWARRLGKQPIDVIEHVRGRLRDEGPLMSTDFEDPRDRRGTWWDWKPQKTALEYLWRTGEVAVSARVNFQKVYDLMERVLPESKRLRAPSRREHVDWACHTALERLGFATPRELRDYLTVVKLEEVRDWCARAEAAGQILQVMLEAEDGSKPRPAWAFADWRKRAARLPDPPRRMRLLNPFDPVLRDRQRTERLFGFEYRLEAFVPAARRTHGYYVLPILEGDRLVGRLDPKLHRDQERLEVRALWWEPGARPSAARKRALERAVGRFAEQLGAGSWTLPRRRQSRAA